TTLEFASSQELVASFSRAGGGCEGLAVQGETLVGFGLEGHIRGRQFLAVAQQQIAAGFQIKMQTLSQSHPLSAGEMGEDIHAEDAIETPQIGGAHQVHLREGDEIAQARLGKKVLIELGKIVLHQGAREGCQSRVRIQSALGECESILANITCQNMDSPTARGLFHRLTHRKPDRIGFFARGAARAQDAQTLRSFAGLAHAQFGQYLFLEYFKGHWMTEETRFSVQNLFEQPFALRILCQQAANELGVRAHPAGLKVRADLSPKHVLRAVQQDSSLTLHEQAQLGQLMFEHQVEGLLPLARPAEIESCIHCGLNACRKFVCPSQLLYPLPTSAFAVRRAAREPSRRVLYCPTTAA